jgi:hypothetical protein
MNKYKIDLSSFTDNGGYSTFYNLKSYDKIAFKEFTSKKKAIYARKIQVKLAKYNLAPKVYSKICKIQFDKHFINQKSGWGYITEIAKTVNKVKLFDIQKIVNLIYKKTNLKFWDCHGDNLGYVIRRGKKKLVCIDTGEETWDGRSNYFGNTDPGPKCSYCLKYKCQCLGD